jgi:hypothetical protein
MKLDAKMSLETFNAEIDVVFFAFIFHMDFATQGKIAIF